MTGPFTSYAKSKGQRGSDFTARIYAAVRLLEISGTSNLEACREIAKYPSVEARLRPSNRGRPRRTSRGRDFLDQVHTVRGLYNSYKRRHPFPEKLPRTDCVLELWWRQFLQVREWAQATIEETNRKRVSIADYFGPLGKSHDDWLAHVISTVRQADSIYGAQSSASTASSISSRAKPSSASPRKTC